MWFEKWPPGQFKHLYHRAAAGTGISSGQPLLSRAMRFNYRQVQLYQELPEIRLIRQRTVRLICGNKASSIAIRVRRAGQAGKLFW